MKVRSIIQNKKRHKMQSQISTKRYHCRSPVLEEELLDWPNTLAKISEGQISWVKGIISNCIWFPSLSNAAIVLSAYG
jgi:hypothetical protein